MGIHTLGQFAALDKEEVGARLGSIGLQLWDRARGKTTRLLKLVSPPESFEEAFEFENEIETIEPLLFILRRFLQQLSLRLDALYLVASELRLQITFSDKSAYQHQFKIPEPTNNGDVLFRMLHTHLENFKSDFSIIAVALKAEAAKPSSQQFNLFETALRDPARLSETLARLTGLLGADRVGTPVLEETHRPDAFRIEPFAWQLKETVGEIEPFPSCALRRFRSSVRLRCCWLKTGRLICAAPKFMVTCSGEKVLTRHQEIGGTKKPGNAPNGIWSWRTARSANAIHARADGNSTEFMIREPRVCLMSSYMRAARSAFCGERLFQSN